MRTTISGTNSADYLYGTRGDDDVFAMDGNDWIVVGFGNDAVYGGRGTDIINDTTNGIQNYYGTDWLFGEGEGDIIDNSHNLSEGSRLYGDYQDFVQGYRFDGDDTIYGGPKWEYIYGGGFDDWLFGNGGDDVIWGDYHSYPTIVDGDDHIIGGAGRDVMHGGGGSDVFIINAGDNGPTTSLADQIVDFSADDYLDMPIFATASNTTWRYVSNPGDVNANYYTAKDAFNAHPNLAYVYVTDYDNGTLYADTNNDHLPDLAVQLFHNKVAAYEMYDHIF